MHASTYAYRMKKILPTKSYTHNLSHTCTHTHTTINSMQQLSNQRIQFFALDSLLLLLLLLFRHRLWHMFIVVYFKQYYLAGKTDKWGNTSNFFGWVSVFKHHLLLNNLSTRNLLILLFALANTTTSGESGTTFTCSRACVCMCVCARPPAHNLPLFLDIALVGIPARGQKRLVRMSVYVCRSCV
jgi:hypothetical protein